MGKGEDAPDAAIVLGIEKVGSMAKNLGDDPLPSRTMEKCRFGAVIDKRVPAQCGGCVGVIEMLDPQHDFQSFVRNR
jgi:hypothetical protein